MRGHPALLQTTARCGVHARRGGSWPSEGDLTGKRRLDRNQRRWEGKPPVCVGRPASAEPLIYPVAPAHLSHVQACFWLYSTDSWVFERVNNALMNDSGVALTDLGPYIKVSASQLLGSLSEAHKIVAFASVEAFAFASQTDDATWCQKQQLAA